MNGDVKWTSSGDGGSSLGEGKSLSLNVLTEAVEEAEKIASSYEDEIVCSLCSGRGRNCKRAWLPEYAL